MGLVLGPEAVSKVLVGIWVHQGTRVVYPGEEVTGPARQLCGSGCKSRQGSGCLAQGVTWQLGRGA